MHGARKRFVREALAALKDGDRVRVLVRHVELTGTVDGQAGRVLEAHDAAEGDKPLVRLRVDVHGSGIRRRNVEQRRRRFFAAREQSAAENYAECQAGCNLRITPARLLSGLTCGHSDAPFDGADTRIILAPRLQVRLLSVAAPEGLSSSATDSEKRHLGPGEPHRHFKVLERVIDAFGSELPCRILARLSVTKPFGAGVKRVPRTVEDAARLAVSSYSCSSWRSSFR